MTMLHPISTQPMPESGAKDRVTRKKKKNELVADLHRHEIGDAAQTTPSMKHTNSQRS